MTPKEEYFWRIFRDAMAAHVARHSHLFKKIDWNKIITDIKKKAK